MGGAIPGSIRERTGDHFKRPSTFDSSGNQSPPRLPDGVERLRCAEGRAKQRSSVEEHQALICTKDKTGAELCGYPETEYGGWIRSVRL